MANLRGRERRRRCAISSVSAPIGPVGWPRRPRPRGPARVLGAVQEGRISADQAGMVAESHKRAPMSSDDQQELLDLGGWQGHDEFKKTVMAREDQRRAEDGMGRAERQRARRSFKVFYGAGGMVVLHAELDQEAGERVKIAVDAMSTKMLGDDIAYDPIRTFEQRNADALVALITQQPAEPGDADATGGPNCGIRPQKTVLVVSADYDVIRGQLKNAGLIDGTPIELDEIRRLACDAQIVPMIFGSDGRPLYMGRAQRAVTEAQKLALYRRDRGCVGCSIRPQACDAHHIQSLGPQRAHRHNQSGSAVPPLPHQSPQTRPYGRTPHPKPADTDSNPRPAPAPKHTRRLLNDQKPPKHSHRHGRD